jgi:hypothetical protein
MCKCKFRKYWKMCKGKKLYSCIDGRNDWDGLCSPEACERSSVIQILVFGFSLYHSYQEYIRRGVPYQTKKISKK